MSQSLLDKLQELPVRIRSSLGSSSWRSQCTPILPFLMQSPSSAGSLRRPSASARPASEGHGSVQAALSSFTVFIIWGFPFFCFCKYFQHLPAHLTVQLLPGIPLISPVDTNFSLHGTLRDFLIRDLLFPSVCNCTFYYIVSLYSILLPFF